MRGKVKLGCNALRIPNGVGEWVVMAIKRKSVLPIR